MKKLLKQLTLGAAMLAMAIPVSAQENNVDILVEKNIEPLGGFKTWYETSGNTFTCTYDELKKLINGKSNSTKIVLFPQGTYLNDDNPYKEQNIETGIQGFYVDMEKSQSIGTINILWEGAYATEYDIWITDNIPDDGIMMEEPVYSTKIAGKNTSKTNSISFEENEMPNGRYLVVQPYDGTNMGWGVGMNWISAYSGSKDQIDHISIPNISIIEGKSVEIPISIYNLSNELVSDYSKLKNFTLTCSDDEAVEINNITDGNFTLTAKEPGSYTLTATAMESEGNKQFSFTSDLLITLDWETRNNIAKGKAILGRYISLEENEHPYSYATDGDTETYYEYDGGWGGGDSWVIVDLGNDYQVDAIEVLFGNNSNGKYKIAFGTSDAELPEGEAINATWKESKAGWTHSPEFNDRRSNELISKLYPEILKIRYIAIIDKDNPQGKPQYKEIYIDGVEYSHELAEIEIVNNLQIGKLKYDCDMFIGETSEITYRFKDQYGVAFDYEGTPELNVSGVGTVTDGVLSVSEIGEVVLTAELDGFTTTRIIKVLDPSSYCITNKISFESDSESATSTITDGGSDPNNTLGAFVLAPNSPAGPEEHYIFADLGANFDLDMIIAIWEGAAPRDYDVYLGTTSKDDLHLAYSITGHTENTWYDRFSTEDMHNVRYIKIVTTYNATGYGLKLYELKAYGTQYSTDWDITAFDEASNLTVEGKMILVTKATNINNDNTHTVLIKSPNGEQVYYEATKDTQDNNGDHNNIRRKVSEANAAVESSQNPGYYEINLPVNKDGGSGTLNLYTKNEDESFSEPETLRYIITTGDNIDTGVEGVEVETATVSVFNMQGICVKKNVKADEALLELPAGLYIVGGKKVIVK